MVPPSGETVSAATTLGPITSLDIWCFAEGIVERYEQTAPSERTDEARMLNALARDHLRMATPPSGKRSPGRAAVGGRNGDW